MDNPPLDSRSSILDDLEKKFGSAKSKADVIHALETCEFLHKIPLPSSPTVTMEQAEKDFCRERVLLNDVAFIPDKNDLDRSRAFALTLRMVLRRLMYNKTVYNEQLYENSDTICDLLMQRACRTSAGADSFFTVQKMLCVEGTFVTQKTLIDDPPVHMDVFIAPNFDEQLSIRVKYDSNDELHSNNNSNHHISSSSAASATDDVQFDGNPILYSANSLLPPSHPPPGDDEDNNHHLFIQHALCARIQVSNSFAIYDVACMDFLGDTLNYGDQHRYNGGDNNSNNNNNGMEEPKPWLEVETVVVDESNFFTGRNWRKLHIIVTCVDTGETYCSGTDEILDYDDAILLMDQYSHNNNNNNNNGSHSDHYNSTNDLAVSPSFYYYQQKQITTPEKRTVISELTSWFRFSQSKQSSHSSSYYQRQGINRPSSYDKQGRHHSGGSGNGNGSANSGGGVGSNRGSNGIGGKYKNKAYAIHHPPSSSTARNSNRTTISFSLGVPSSTGSSTVMLSGNNNSNTTTNYKNTNHNGKGPYLKGDNNNHRDISMDDDDDDDQDDDV
jgi:hypothetical protein